MSSRPVLLRFALLALLGVLAVVGQSTPAEATVGLTPFVTNHSARPGDFVSIALSVTSSDPVSSTYLLSVDPPDPSWTVITDHKSVTVEASTPRVVFATLRVPAQAPAGQVQVHLALLASAGGAEVAAATVTIQVEASLTFHVLPPSTTSAAPGETVTCVFLLSNAGNVPASLFVSVESDLERLSSAGGEIIQVLAGEERALEVLLRVPAGYTREVASTTLVACAQGGQAVCEQGSALTQILPPGPDRIPGIPRLLFPADLRLSVGGGGSPATPTLNGTFHTSGTFPDGSGLALDLSLAGLDPPRISAAGLRLLRIGGEPLDLSLNTSGAERGFGLSTRLPLGSASLEFTDAYGVQTPGRTTVVLWETGSAPASLRASLAGSLSEGQLDWSLGAHVSLQDKGLLLPPLGGPLSLEGSVDWTGPRFFGGNKDIMSLSFAAEGRTRDALAAFLHSTAAWNNVLREMTVKSYRVQAMHAGLLGQLLDSLWFKAETGRSQKDWDPLPIETGWRERREEETLFSAAIGFRSEGFSFSAGNSARNLLLEGVRDDDGDGLFDEDPVDGVDNDGDGRVDEDPPNRDEFRIDGMNLVLDVRYGLAHLEIGCDETATWAPASPTPMDGSSSWHFGLGLDLLENLSAETSLVVRGQAWNFAFLLTYHGNDWQATLRHDLVSAEVGAGVFEQQLRVGVDFEARFLVATPFMTQGQVEGVVFIDENENGVRDPGEEGVPEVSLRLGPVRARTGASGRFRFPAVDPGTYTLAVESLPAGLHPQAPSYVERVVVGETLTELIPVRRVASVVGVVVLDINGDGEPDTGEPGIPQVRVALAGAAAAQEVLTSADGRFSFTNLAPGDYRIILDPRSLPPRYIPTSPVEAVIRLSGGDERSVSFAAREVPRPIVMTFGAAALDFTWSPEGSGPVYAFTATLPPSGENAILYRWDFGDNRVPNAEGASARATFPAAGTYHVTLTATDAAGRVSQIAKDILVK